MSSLVLASGSPRRRELLARLVADYKLAKSDVEEASIQPQSSWFPEPLSLPAPFRLPQESHPTLWAWLKAIDVAESIPRGSQTLILAADTVVIGEDAVLGKPTSDEAADLMLRSLRGKMHYVVTGSVLAVPGAGEPIWSNTTVTAVWLRAYTDVELTGYVATGEPLDKAGAYAVQGLGAALVARVEGCYFNVVGLPLCRVRAGLVEAGLETLPYPDGGYCAFCSHR